MIDIREGIHVSSTMKLLRVPQHCGNRLEKRDQFALDPWLTEDSSPCMHKALILSGDKLNERALHRGSVDWGPCPNLLAYLVVVTSFNYNHLCDHPSSIVSNSSSMKINLLVRELFFKITSIILTRMRTIKRQRKFFPSW